MTRVYEYDVFISYQREGNLIPAWVRTHLYPRLLEVLHDNLDRDVKVFFDEKLPGGVKVPSALRSALQRTRVLLAVCSPRYFLNEWCLAEWHSMARREEMVGMTSSEQSHGLIYPVIFCDSENFPNYAHERRLQDLKTWNLPYPQFQDTVEYLGFHREVQRIAEELVDLLERVPEWRPDWPVDTPEPGPPTTPKLPRF
ncbi:toll/interleukin-1 receptor domain-containing protein [Actinokineospora sp. NBRC 105648]|uniref:toll/interleukin-1 receptor domain-containing protein n=1 Tax=Actinokineospora sp. NBRC 105648 TaxID=3032206 RepID=UPI0024A4BE84|nr:toll/interleukin-1 receptor domain-containing protein [Actinokineospora sp. NBRC 105648]GLZ41936.1 hypothetical protein Acsp05_55600 [Actinokineospora sp. NBRC 105648]